MVNAHDYAMRPATADDLPLLARWLRAPAVRRWWGDPERELRLLEEDLNDPAMTMLIASCDGRAIGYLQEYDVHAWPQACFAHLPPGTRAIDMFIGEADMLGAGHGSALLRRLALRLKTAGAPAVAIDPDPQNARAIRAYEKAGFVIDRPVETDEGAALLMLFRDTLADSFPGGPPGDATP